MFCKLTAYCADSCRRLECIIKIRLVSVEKASLNVKMICPPILLFIVLENVWVHINIVQFYLINSRIGALRNYNKLRKGPAALGRNKRGHDSTTVPHNISLIILLYKTSFLGPKKAKFLEI